VSPDLGIEYVWLSDSIASPRRSSSARLLLNPQAFGQLARRQPIGADLVQQVQAGPDHDIRLQFGHGDSSFILKFYR
jgi:hypothetical protein